MGWLPRLTRHEPDAASIAWEAFHLTASKPWVIVGFVPILLAMALAHYAGEWVLIHGEPEGIEPLPNVLAGTMWLVLAPGHVRLCLDAVRSDPVRLPPVVLAVVRSLRMALLALVAALILAAGAPLFIQISVLWALFAVPAAVADANGFALPNMVGAVRRTTEQYLGTAFAVSAGGYILVWSCLEWFVPGLLLVGTWWHMACAVFHVRVAPRCRR